MSETTEAHVLERLVPELEAEGYEVYLHPHKLLRPSFLGDFTPDAVALRQGRNLVIEVLTESPTGSDKLAKLTRLLQGQTDWGLRAVWISQNENPQPPQVQQVGIIQDRIGEMKELAAEGHVGPAMLLGWATFEALGRAVLTEQFNRPQTPGRLVEVLATEGYLTPSEADWLRQLAESRNKLVHGELQVHVSEQELRDFAAVLEAMLQQVPQ
jgi:hypothetical protein